MPENKKPIGGAPLKEGPKLDRNVTVAMTAEQLALVDKARGREPRGQWCRRHLLAAAEAATKDAK